MKEIIKKLRKESGFNQDEVAIRLGISTRGYQRKEYGDVDFEVVELVKMCEMFGYEMFLVKRDHVMTSLLKSDIKLTSVDIPKTKQVLSWKEKLAMKNRSQIRDEK